MKDIDLVDLQTINPRIRLDIRYATEDNVTKVKLYPSAKCFLRKAVADRLNQVQKKLEKEGLGLKVYDGYRPLSIQKIIWKHFPDPRYVADPEKGSKHNRGASVDLTLVTREGKELNMPSEFDDFSEKAHRNYMNLDPEQIENRKKLETEMSHQGFLPWPHEWWHFDDPNWEGYDLLDVPFDELMDT